jgi:hypothetical protein
MTPKQKAEQLIIKFIDSLPANAETDINKFLEVDKKASKECALIAVNEIIASNPHSNPFNTEIYSTMGYWQEVRREINNI